jgi:hypothetical protein
LLGCQVRGGADARAGCRHPGRVAEECDPEVGQPDARRLGIADHVAWLHIAMDDVQPVRVHQRLGQLLSDRDRLLDAERPSGQHVGERRTVDQFEHQVGDAVVQSRAAQPHHARVVESAEHLDLCSEPAHALRIDHAEEFDGDRLARREVPGAEHLPHPTAAQQLLDLMALVDQHPCSEHGMSPHG